MFKKMSISKKIQIPLIASILFGFFVIMVNYYYSIEDMKSDVYKSQKDNLRTVYNEAITSKGNIGITNAINISKNYYVIRALKENNRELAIEELNRLSKEFKDYTSYHNIKIHIHDANIHSFLRAWSPNK
ncbi:MAG: methyl-accepting chemotaxis protein, partial [Sulfurimonas sp.]